MRLLSVLPILALASTLGFPTGAATQSRTLVGVGSHSLDAPSVRHLERLGVKHVRYTIYWKRWVGSPEYASRVRADLDRATEAGLNVLAVVHDQPPNFSFQNRNAAYRAYAEFMGGLAAEFPQVRAWQLWNEMEVEGFTDLFGAGIIAMPARGAAYGEMLRLTYPAIKRANPRALVVTGGIASPVMHGFLDGLLDSRAPFDAVGIHAYGFPERIPVQARGEEARSLLRRHGRGAVPIWLTEFGMEAAVVAPGWDNSRAAIDRYHLEAWRGPVLWNDATGIYARMYGHALQEGGDLSYDLIRRDGSLRPAAQWLQVYLSQ